MTKIESRRFKCFIDFFDYKRNLIKIKLINYPHIVHYRLPLRFFDEIGLTNDRFWFIVFEDESIALKKFDATIFNGTSKNLQIGQRN